MSLTLGQWDQGTAQAGRTGARIGGRAATRLATEPIDGASGRRTPTPNRTYRYRQRYCRSEFLNCYARKILAAFRCP